MCKRLGWLGNMARIGNDNLRVLSAQSLFANTQQPGCTPWRSGQALKIWPDHLQEYPDVAKFGMLYEWNSWDRISTDYSQWNDSNMLQVLVVLGL